MILGVIAIFLVSCHNANAMELITPATNRTINKNPIHKNLSKNTDFNAKMAEKLFGNYSKINQAADLGINLRSYTVV